MGPRTKPAPPPLPPAHIVEVHARLFSEDIDQLKKIAEEHGSSWQFELRLLVRSALRGGRREITILKEQP